MTTTSIWAKIAAIGIVSALALSLAFGASQGHASELQADAPAPVKTQATATGGKYALLAKDGRLYPCDAKGKKTANAWDAYAKDRAYQVTKLFVAANAKKVPDRVRYREYYKYSKKTKERTYSLSSLSKLKNVTFLIAKGRNSCKSIAAGAFSYRSGLKTLTNFGKTKVTSIGKSAFSHTGLRKVAFPPTLKTIGSSAFNTCTSLKAVSGLEKTRISSVSDYAFYQSAVTRIALPRTVTTIGSWAFSDCSSLVGITLLFAANGISKGIRGESII